MFTILSSLLFFSLLISLNQVILALNSDIQLRYHLKWITQQTVYPFSFQLPHYDLDLVDYDWYKYDADAYVTQLENYRPNYFVSKQPYKTKLTIFKFDIKTNEQLTTYEPVRIVQFDDEIEQKHRDLYTLLLLDSHRIRIDRSLDHANVSCIADFYVDQNSMPEPPTDLMQVIRDLALFDVSLKEEISQYSAQPAPEKKSWSKNHMLKYKKANQVGYGKKTGNIMERPEYGNDIKLVSRQHRNKRSVYSSSINNNNFGGFYETEELDEENNSVKKFFKIRLAYGPVQVKKPFKPSLISCDLDLINADDVNLDHRSRIFKYLFSEDIGLDKDDIDKNDGEEDAFVIISELNGNKHPPSLADIQTDIKNITDNDVDNNNNETEISLIQFIPRFTVDTLNETLDELPDTIDESKNIEVAQKNKKGSLLFLLDNDEVSEGNEKNSSSKFNSYSIILILKSIFLYLYIYA